MFAITLTLDDEASIRPPGNQQHKITQYANATYIQSRTFGILPKMREQRKGYVLA